MLDYLNDMSFLKELDKLNIRVLYAKIVLLSFAEKPIREILGNITSGSLNVNSSSAIRRTISLSMLASFDNANIENIDNEISINKKVKIFIGYKNPLKSYKHYGDIIWFPCGLFVISSASVSRSISGWSISISGKDKMCLLDGTAGGTLPACTTFHESLIEEDNGDITIVKPTIFKIIYEAVNHFGGEAIENIIITDVDEKVKMLVRYVGDNPIYFSDNYESLSFLNNANNDFPHMYTYGKDAGYQEVDFTYPGELILQAGDTVVTLLNKITDVLGNFEYFYDINGRFIFLEIKNYLNTGSPLTELSPDDYVRSYDNSKFLYSLTDLDSTTTITRSPKYDKVKNNFYVWGKRKTTSDIEVNIRYHLAIDTKPLIDLAGLYMWKLVDKNNFIVRYEFTYNDIPPSSLYKAEKIGIPCDEWREELYRQALNAQVTNSVYNNNYDAELIAEWRNLYDPLNTKWNKTGHWNPDVFEDPAKINFWLDFIDTGSELGKYSINEIGCRTKVINNDNIKTVYNSEVPDIIFIEGLNLTLMAEYEGIGLRYFILTPEYYNLFSISTTGVSCFDKIREMMYQNLNYNTTISLSCLPKYYMEPNNIIHIEDKESGINGNYLITQFSLPLAYNGVMNITATEVLTRV